MGVSIQRVRFFLLIDVAMWDGLFRICNNPIFQITMILLGLVYSLVDLIQEAGSQKQDRKPAVKNIWWCAICILACSNSACDILGDPGGLVDAF